MRLYEYVQNWDQRELAIPFVLRIGVTGHRLLPNDQIIRKSVSEVVQKILEIYMD